MTEKQGYIRQLWTKGRDRLTELYDKEEAGVIMDWLLEEYVSVSRAMRISGMDESVDRRSVNKIEKAVGELLGGRPVQYVIGKAWFHGLEFMVDERVLIPRPETEELVSMVAHDLGGAFTGKILDIGTGSGCIAITLARSLPGAEVWALDHQEDILGLARENARINTAGVSFLIFDIVRDDTRDLPGVDVIVSNPPYVLDSEKQQMRKNVLDHEPGSALFVSDEDPLFYYRHILEIANEKLEPGGSVFLEINEKMGNRLIALMQEYGFTYTRLDRDMKGKDRFLRASRQSWS